MPGLTEFARAGLQVNDAIDQGEIADNLCFVTAKTTIRIATTSAGDAGWLSAVKESAQRPCHAETGGRRRATSSPPHAVSGDIHAVKSETIAQREDVKNIPDTRAEGRKIQSEKNP